MSTVVELAVVAVAAGNVARLLSDDTILEGPRSRLERWLTQRARRFPNNSIELKPSPWTWFIELLNCARCVSFWTTLAGLGLWLLNPTLAVWLAAPWAAWALASIVGTWGDE